jgi:hypothetical protein
MSGGLGRRDKALLALLPVPAAYLVALAARPATTSATWPLLIAGVGAIAAMAGAGVRLVTGPDGWSGRAGQRRRQTGWLAAVGCAGALAGVLLQAALQVIGGATLDTTTLSRTAMTSSGLAMGAWLVARRLATDLLSVDQFGRAAEGALPVARVLLGIGCVALAGAGRVQWTGDAAAGWASAVPVVAVLVYAGMAFAHVRRHHERALTAAWRRTNRVAQSDLFGNSRATLVGLVCGMLAMVALWLLPALEPARRVVERTPPEAVERLRAFVGEASLDREDLRREGAVAGESMRGGDPGTIDDERRAITVRTVLDWLLDPVGGMAGDLAPPDRDDQTTRSIVPPRLVIALTLAAATALLAYWRARGGRRSNARPGRLRRVLASVREMLRALLAGLRRARRHGTPASATRGPAESTTRSRPVRHRLRPTLPREQVKHDYRRVLDLAGHRGIPRELRLSPAEYARVLRPALPEHGESVEELTSAFVEARYSDHDIEAAVAQRTRQASREIRRALKEHGPVAPS